MHQLRFDNNHCVFAIDKVRRENNSLHIDPSGVDFVLFAVPRDDATYVAGGTAAGQIPRVHNSNGFTVDFPHNIHDQHS